MSDTPVSEEQKIEAAAAEFEAFRIQFEDKHGYGIAALSRITPDGRIETVLQLVKLLPKVENTANTTPNGNGETKEAGQSDSSQQPEPAAA